MDKKTADMGDAILEINPEIKFTYLDEDYDTLKILSDHEKPTKEAIESAKVKAQQKIDDTYYKIQRAVAYPSIQDQLDMQYWDQINGTTTWKDAIAKVKADNPKP